MQTQKKAVSAGFQLTQFVYNILLLLSGIILFTLPQPNFLTVNGFPFLIYFSLIPVFILVRRLSWKTVWLYGFLYGFGCYCLYTYWLATFHPAGISVIASMYGIYLMIAFPVFKAVYHFFPKYGWLIQWIAWCAYEYIKTIGFSGFHYGVTGYSQWQNPVLRQCTDVVGIWGLSALITFPSCFLAEIFSKLDKNCFKIQITCKIKKHLTSAVVWICCIVAAVIYGIISTVDYSAEETMKVVLVQPNNDPWLGGLSEYSKNLEDLIRLTDNALAEDKDIKMVVWPETAFVPRIEWHYRYRQERAKYELVETLLNYIDSKEVPFIIGNDHGVAGYNKFGQNDILDYNSALLFVPGKNCIPPNPEKYFKMHLVPFTEYFPFETQFPKLYEILLNGDTHMWEPGKDPVVFKVGDLKFGTPICFEDTFGDTGRKFVLNGARAFVNISNDAWSKSAACQYQHLSMAVFRCVENRVPAVRATASGQTVLVDSNGKVLKMAEPFKQTYITVDLPVIKNYKETIYTKYGDIVGIAFAIAGLGLFLVGLTKTVVKSIKNNGDENVR